MDPAESESEASRASGASAERSSSSAGGDRWSLRRLAADHPRIVLLAWLLLWGWIGVRVAHEDVRASGDIDGLLPLADRAAPTEHLVLFWLEPSHADDTSASTDALLAAADDVHRALGEIWLPAAPPASEISAWLDTHARYLVPLNEHPELRARMSDDAIAATAEGLRARLSSPFFGLSSDDARRDPLGMRDLIGEVEGRLGYVRAGTPAGARVTPNGDLVAGDGTALLMALRTGEPEPAFETISTVIAGGPVHAAIVGPARRRDDARQLITTYGRQLIAVTLAAVTLVLASVLRQVRAAIAVLVALATGVAVASVLVQTIDPLSLPLLVLLGGFGCEGALHLQRISERGWPATAVLGTALMPLLLSAYPQWQAWAWHWLIAFAIMVLLLRLYLPALLRLTRGRPPATTFEFQLRPHRIAALICAALVLGGGGWASTRIGYRGADRIDLGEAIAPPEQRRLVRDFYDPMLVVVAKTFGSDANDALIRGADHARRLMGLVPDQASRVDSPGSFVLHPQDAERRRAALADLDLAERTRVLSEALQARGFDPAAFNEFAQRDDGQRGALPTPAAALQSPLARWIEGYMERDDDGVVLRTRVHLLPDPDALLPALGDEAETTIPVFGPAAAARSDRATFMDRLGVLVLSQLWLGSFLVWLGTRRLSTAISAAFAALITQMGVVAILAGSGGAIGPASVPALLLVGGAALVAAGRACRAIDLERPLFATGLLVVSLCQVAAGLVLIATNVPLWGHVGAIVTTGALLASGVGLFVAPGLADVLRSLRRASQTSGTDATR